MGRIFTHLREHLWGATFMENLSRKRGVDWCHFPPPPLSKNVEPLAGSREAGQHQHWLINLLTPNPIPPCTLVGTTLLSQGCHSPSTADPSPKRPAQTLAHTISLKPGVLKVSRPGWHRARRALCCSWREARQITWGIGGPDSVETVI